MHEEAYSLFQLVGIAFVLFLTGLSIGIMMGKEIQRKRYNRFSSSRFGKKGRRP